VKLEIDAGNTLVKWRLFDGNNIMVERGVVGSKKDIKSFFSDTYFFSKVSVLLISSVSEPGLEHDICKMFEEKSGSCKVFKATSKKEMGGVCFVYDDVSRLGVDRCLAMVAAFNQINDGVLVVDCGSAMTADFVLATGQHIGGYIFPGLRLLKGALLTGTSGVSVDIEVPRGYGLGKNTGECVENGVNLMMKSTLLGLAKLAAQNDIEEIVLTGGDGELAQELLGEGIYDADLVFKGLSLVGPY